MKKYHLIVSGGTFDHLHKGHEDFLNFQLDLSENLIIGLTSDSFVKKIKQKGIESFWKRKSNLQNFFRKTRAEKRMTIIKIEDMFIPKTIESELIEAIAVTKKTENGAFVINQDRQKRGLRKLMIETFPLVLAEDRKPISSSRIRKGMIDRQGKRYLDPKWTRNTLLITEGLREILSSPFGKIVNNSRLKKIDFSKTVTVGDITSRYFNSRKFKQRIAVIDYCVARKKEFATLEELGFSGRLEETIKISNPPGTITPLLFKASQKALRENSRKQVIIEIEGEEDLAVLPFLIILPLDFCIFYGQPGTGMIEVEVTEDNKEKARRILREFVLQPRLTAL